MKKRSKHDYGMFGYNVLKSLFKNLVSISSSIVHRLGVKVALSPGSFRWTTFYAQFSNHFISVNQLIEVT